MQHPDEGTIHAWIDDELPPEEATALEAHLKECTECSALVAEARGLVAASSRIVSALDIVPGGVIPKTTARRRPWYASTQLRAAAAVAIVAGASLLVMRDQGKEKMERAVQVSPMAAPQVSPLELDSAASRNEVAGVIAEAPAPVAQTKPVKKKAEVETRPRLEKSAANDAAKITSPQDLAAPPATASRAAADEVGAVKPPARKDSAQRRIVTGDMQLSEVVVTGVAVAAGPGELKKVRTDSSTNATVYEASPGVEVTLFDKGQNRPVLALRASGTAQAKERQAAGPTPAAAPEPVPAAKVDSLSRSVAGARLNAVPINAISWTDKRGHLMVLTGRVSKEVLEGIRKRLPADQR